MVIRKIQMIQSKLYSNIPNPRFSLEDLTSSSLMMISNSISRNMDPLRVLSFSRTSTLANLGDLVLSPSKKNQSHKI
jgi:hypothetical protein